MSWNRSDRVIQIWLNASELSLPFAMLGYDSDNGGEVLNQSILRWLRQRSATVTVTRSRPYHKNDNAYVEQKNLTHIQLFLGWGRITPMTIKLKLQTGRSKACNQQLDKIFPCLSPAQFLKLLRPANDLWRGDHGVAGGHTQPKI